MNGKFILYITRLPLTLIKKLNNSYKGVFISSYLDSYTEEYINDNYSISQRLMKFGIPCYQIHASGHVMPHDLYNFIIDVKPTILIPIHTERAEFFNNLFRNLEIEVLIPAKYEKISIN